MPTQQYTPLQQGATPTLGTSGAAVSALQQQLNQQNAGVAGYTPLTVDGMYGPLTQAASQFQAPNAGVDTSEPVGTAFQMPSLGNSYETDPNYIRSQQIITNNLNGIDNVDTNAIRSQTLADFQDRINAINSVYAGKLAEAQQQGKGRVGSTTSILANRGLAGSMRGGAIAEGTLTQNRQIEDAINAEKAAAISSIYSQVNSQAQAEAERRRQAIEGGAKSYIDFIKGQETTKQTNLGNTVGAFIAQGIDPSTMTPDELKGIADKLKVTTGDIISQYKQKEFESQAAQREQELKNNQPFELSEGQARFAYNPQTGKFDKVASVGKTYANTGGTSGGSTSVGLAGFPQEIQSAAQSILDGKSKLNEYPSAKRLQINEVMSKLYTAEGGNELAQGAYDSIVNLENNPGFKSAIGAKGLSSFYGIKNSPIAGSQAAGFVSELDKLKANLKLVNIKYLKGTGALSDAEGKTLEDAGTTLSTNLPEKQFKEELARIKKALLKASTISTSSQSGTNVTPSGVTYTIEP